MRYWELNPATIPLRVRTKQHSKAREVLITAGKYALVGALCGAYISIAAVAVVSAKVRGE